MTAPATGPVAIPARAWLWASGLAIVLGLIAASINWLVRGEFHVAAEVVAAMFTGAVLSEAGFRVHQRPVATLALIAGAVVVISGLKALLTSAQ